MNNTTDSGNTKATRFAMISVEQALGYLLEQARPVTESESLPLEVLPGRIVAQTQCSLIDVPGFDNSSMDGIAVRSQDASGAAVTLNIAQRIAAGGTGVPLTQGQAARIFTGAPLPPGADAVVMQENCEFRADQVSFQGPVPIGQHVRSKGNNIRRGADILCAGARIRPQELGIAAAGGLAVLPVFRRLKVAFFSSGDELIEPGKSLQYGQIYNSNRYTLRGLVEGLGCESIDLGIVEDSLTATKGLLRDAAGRADVVISSGGVSVGEEDHIKAAIESVGCLEMWNIAVKPGKPVAYGRIGEADFLGLPGNPVSTLVAFCMFARPFIMRRQGVTDVLPQRVPVVADFDWPTPMRRREFVRARINIDTGGRAIASLFPKQGSDVLSSTVWASGLVEIPEHTSVVKGDLVAYLDFEQLLH